MTTHDPSVRFADTSPASLERKLPLLWRRAKPVLLALIVPLLLLAFWQVATTRQWTRLIPTPGEVAEYMVDFAVGGIYDDAYSATLTTHLLASMSRVLSMSSKLGLSGRRAIINLSAIFGMSDAMIRRESGCPRYESSYYPRQARQRCHQWL